MEEKDYSVKVTFCLSYFIDVRAESKDDAIQQATEYAFEDFSGDLCGNLDASDFGSIAEIKEEE